VFVLENNGDRRGQTSGDELLKAIVNLASHPIVDCFAPFFAYEVGQLIQSEVFAAVRKVHNLGQVANKMGHNLFNHVWLQALQAFHCDADLRDFPSGEPR
jgi:hypothetical protein